MRSFDVHGGTSRHAGDMELLWSSWCMRIRTDTNIVDGSVTIFLAPVYSIVYPIVCSYPILTNSTVFMPLRFSLFLRGMLSSHRITSHLLSPTAPHYNV